MNHEAYTHPDHPYIKLPGLPLIGKDEYNQTKKISCLNTSKSSKNDELFQNFNCGKFDLCLIKHTGKPFHLSKQHTIKPNDHYLDVLLDECLCFNELILSITELIKFVEDYPGINWLVGTSWLASVDDGRLVRRFGFHPTKIHVPHSIRQKTTETGLSKQTLKSHYFKTVEEATVRFMYAPREDFLLKSRYNTFIR